MKAALNGALTIGTLDGANIEIRQEVGADNFFLFGLTADEACELWREGYRPADLYRSDPDKAQALQARYAAVETELMESLARWEALEAKQSASGAPTA